MRNVTRVIGMAVDVDAVMLSYLLIFANQHQTDHFDLFSFMAEIVIETLDASRSNAANNFLVNHSLLCRIDLC